MKRALVFVLTPTLAMVFCSSAMATPLSLKDLVGTDLSIESGGLCFNNFEYSAIGDMPLAESVEVTPFSQDGNFGITFQSVQGDFGDSYLSIGASIATICYQVAVCDPNNSNKRISAAHISGAPFVSGAGLMQVVETFQSDDLDETISIYYISQGPLEQFDDSADFANSYETLYVQKHILAYAQTVGSEAKILSVINQSFSQVLVPEPSTAVILITGLVLLGCFVRRNRH